MAELSKEKVETALRNAHKSGNTKAARRLAKYYKANFAQETPKAPEPPGFMEQVGGTLAQMPATAADMASDTAGAVADAAQSAYDAATEDRGDAPPQEQQVGEAIVDAAKGVYDYFAGDTGTGGEPSAPEAPKQSDTSAQDAAGPSFEDVDATTEPGPKPDAANQVPGVDMPMARPGGVPESEQSAGEPPGPLTNAPQVDAVTGAARKAPKRLTPEEKQERLKEIRAQQQALEKPDQDLAKQLKQEGQKLQKMRRNIERLKDAPLTPKKRQELEQAAQEYNRRLEQFKAQRERYNEQVDAFKRQQEQLERQAEQIEAAESPEPKDYNLLRSIGDRATDLMSGLATVYGAFSELTPEGQGLMGGASIAYGEPSYTPPEKQKTEVNTEQIRQHAEALEKMNFDYIPESTWEDVKSKFSEGGPLDGSAWSELLSYGLEQGVKSTPDMVAATLALPGYVVARAGEIGKQRAKNKGKDEAQVEDVLEAAPAALGSAILERLGARGITKAGAETLGKEAMKKGIAKVAAKEGAKAGTKEAGTEAMQEGVIEYVGEKYGTDAAMSVSEAFDRGLGGAVAGGTYGGVAGATTAAGRQVQRGGPEKQIGRALDELVRTAEPEGLAQIAAGQFDPANAQVEAVVEDGGKSVADYVREQTQQQTQKPEMQTPESGFTGGMPANTDTGFVLAEGETGGRDDEEQEGQADARETEQGAQAQTAPSEPGQLGQQQEAPEATERTTTQQEETPNARQKSQGQKLREEVRPGLSEGSPAVESEPNRTQQEPAQEVKPEAEGEQAPSEPQSAERLKKQLEAVDQSIQKAQKAGVPVDDRQVEKRRKLEQALADAQANEAPQQDSDTAEIERFEGMSADERQSNYRKAVDLAKRGELTQERANELYWDPKMLEQAGKPTKLRGRGAMHKDKALQFLKDAGLKANDAKQRLGRTPSFDSQIGDVPMYRLEDLADQVPTEQQEQGDESARVGETSEGTLGGAPAEPAPEAERGRGAGPSRGEGRADDVEGGRAAGERGGEPGRGVPAGEGTVSVPTGGERAGDRGREPDGRGDADQERAGEPGRRRSGDDGVVSRGDAEAVEAQEEAAEKAPVQGATTQPATPAQERPAELFTLTEDMLNVSGPKTKFKANVAAIETLKTVEAEGRAPTPDEQRVMAQYVGWGGLPQAFGQSKDWQKEAARLKELLTEAEYEAARRSTQDAHYTAPNVVQGMWKAVQDMGFTGGRILEPSVGTGNFLGFMPGEARQSQIHAVELDSLTGRIAQQLYPGANVKAGMGFQDYATPDGYFDLAIGNPPFGNQKLYDGQRKHLSNFSIHNYFFAKSVDALRENGVLAMVVSHRFMDGARDDARQYIADRTELLGAVRLPNNAFLKNAGTEVTTDIVFLRKRAQGEEPQGESWLDVVETSDAEGRRVPLNEYFNRHPEMMLGEWGAYGSMYGPNEPALVARPDQDTDALLREALARLPKGFMDQPGHTIEQPQEPLTANVETVKVGSVFQEGDQIKVRLEDQFGEPRAEAVEFKSAKERQRVEGMIEIRDIFARLRQAQLSEKAPDSAIEGLRRQLNEAYDRFVKAQGPINANANKRLMRDDPSWPQLAALEENFDKGLTPQMAKKTGEKPRKPSADKAPVFFKRTQRPYQPPQSAESAQDALLASLNEYGGVNMAYMAQIRGQTEEAIARELGPLVYEAAPGQWVTREEYLSGNVKQKLAEAKRLAEQDARFDRNVEALEEVQPADIEAVDIDVKPGAHWLPQSDMRDFVNHIMGNESGKATYVPTTAKWEISGTPAESSKTWGTDRMPVKAVVEAAANQKQLVIRDKIDENTTEVNTAATNAANEKVERVKAEFRRWIWRDDSRRERLVRRYNDTFNTHRQRQYDGSHLKLPGKVSDDIIRLRPSQMNAAWRIVQPGTTLLDHTVGAGKTFTMIAGGMELRRTGAANKPMYVVPNHLVGQWADDFIKLYPGAKVLATTQKDFAKANRKKLFSRIATGDWDAVIVAHSSFNKVQMDPEFQERFIKQQVRDIDEAIENLRAEQGKSSRSIKQIEKQKEKLNEKLERLYDARNKDDNLTFGELGIDALFVDEAQEFKNLGFATSIQRVAGLGNPEGSQKASDLFMKVQHVLERTGGNNVTFATGTPISNSMAEMYTLQRYLDYDNLQAQGIAHFDAWARMYGDVVTDWELSPQGTYKLKSRFAKFVNVPELMQRYLSFADVITNDDIKAQLAAQGRELPIPAIEGGKPQNIVAPRSQDQADYIGQPRKDDEGREYYPAGSLIDRAENLPKTPEPGGDNMLKIMSDARKAALDMRLIDPQLYEDHTDSKVNEAASRIKSLYDQWAEDRGTQLVFIDLSTPKGAKAQEAARIRDLARRAEEGDDAAQEQLDNMSPDELEALDGEFSVYDDLRQKLINRGIAESEIAFIHDANTEHQKEELFAKVRSGQVRVLMGSTQKMGAGMNVQERLVGLHHLDAPWRPSDLEQREGRIIRQGNVLYERDPQNFAVQINRYATEQTLDSRMWQTIETKANFIEQIRKGHSEQRQIEDVAAESANAAEMKAASSGNPLILEEQELKRQINRLEGLRDEHEREQFQIKDKIRSLERRLEAAKKRSLALAKDAKAAERIEQFGVTVEGGRYDRHKEAGQAILDRAAQMAEAGVESAEIGTYGEFTLALENISGQQFALTATNQLEHQFEIKDFEQTDPKGLAQRLQNGINGLGKANQENREFIESAQNEISELQGQIQEFPQEQELEDVRARYQKVVDQLKPQEQSAEPQPDTQSMAVQADMDVPMPQWQPMYQQMGSLPPRPRDDQFKLGNRTVKLKETPTRREQIRVMVESIIGSRLYQGKVKGKARVGFYRRSNAEVRVDAFDDVEVMAHEMAHFLDMYSGMKGVFTKAYRDKAYRDEVEALSYTSDRKLRASEGFAEFVRLWLTQYEEAKSRAPLFTDRFEQILADDKELGRKMRRLQEEMHRWFLQGDLARLDAKTSGNQYTPEQKIIRFVQRRPGELWRQHYIDKFHAAKVMSREIHGGIREAEQDAYKQLQLLGGIEGVVEQAFKKGAPVVRADGDLEFQGPSMEDIWRESINAGRERMRAQELYFVARRAQELKKQGRENLISEGEIQQGLKMGVQYPYFREKFKQYQQYRENMMEFFVDTGYVTREAAEKMLEVNQNYVPFNRVVEGVDEAYTGANNFQRLKGGTRNVEQVYDNMLMQESRHIYAALKAKALRELYEDAIRSEEGSNFMAPIAPDAEPVRATVAQMAQKTAMAMSEMGVNVSKDGMIEGQPTEDETVIDTSDITSYFEQNPEQLMFWTFGHKPKVIDTRVDSFIDSAGKRRWVEIKSELVADMLDQMDGVMLPKGALGTAIKFSMQVKNLQTLTITSMAQFLGPNIVRDQQQAFILSGGKFVPLVDTMKGLATMLSSLLKDGTYYQEMKAQGGPTAGRVQSFISDNWGVAGAVEYQPRKPIYNPTQLARDLLSAYMNVADSAEMATRAGFYMKMRNQGKSAREAAWLAREITTDFRKHGSYSPWVLLQRTTPFMGAYVQSVDRDFRAFAEKDGEMKWKNLFRTESGRVKLNDMKLRLYMAGASMAAIAGFLAAINADDERYKRLTKDQKARFFHLFIGDQHITIPKPHGFVALVAQGVESMVDMVQGARGDQAAKNMAWAVGYHFGADATPGILNPVAELALNRDFTGAPIVPRSAQKRSPRYQYDSRTPELYKGLGEALGISPDKAHHLVQGYTGYLSDFIDEASQRMLWDEEEWGPRPYKKDLGEMAAKQFTPRAVPYRTKFTQNYYDLKERAKQAKANYEFLTRPGQVMRGPEKLEEFQSRKVNQALLAVNRMFKQMDRVMSQRWEALNQIERNPNLTAAEKEKRAEKLLRQKNELIKNQYQNARKLLDQIEQEMPD